MLKNETTHVGKVLGSYGLSGFVQFALEPGVKLLPDAIQVVFLKHGDMLVPYFVEEFAGPDKLKLEEIDSPESAAALRNKQLHVNEAAVEVEKVEEDSPLLLMGYSVYSDGALIGKIEAVEEYPQQWMFFVKSGDRECMIPFVEDWIEYIEADNQKIFFNLPDGLVTA